MLVLCCVSTSTNCSVGKRMSWLSCAFSMIIFSRQSVWIIAGAFSFVLTAKSSPSTIIAEPTSHVASSVNEKNFRYFNAFIFVKHLSNWISPSLNVGASICRTILAIRTSMKPTMLISKIEIIGSMLISNRSTRTFSAKFCTISGTWHSLASRFA